MKTVFATVAALAFVGSAGADTIYVPAGGDIQAAINSASDGDIIQLAAGEYLPVATIDTIGKAVTLRGVPGKGKDGAPTTVIDGQDSIRVLQCTSGEGPGTEFENLLITGGLADGDLPANDEGGGMRNSGSSPTLSNCVFTGNSADSGGGGMRNTNSNPTLENCTFTGNSANSIGGGMFNDSSSPTLENCTFTNNSASSGGGMYNYDSSSPTLSNCAFTGNSATYGGGMYNYFSSPTLTNTILCSNTPDQVDGNWTDNGGNCVQESCDDCGWCENDQDGDGVCDKDDQCPGEPDVDSDGDGIPDCLECPGDITANGIVDAADLGILLAVWGTDGKTTPDADVNNDGNIDGGDLGLLLFYWGPCP